MRRPFTFAYERTIDSKNRVSIPATWRSLWEQPPTKSCVYLTPGFRPNTISIYTEDDFNTTFGQVHTEHMSPEEALEFEQAFFGSVLLQELDSQGRVTIPDELLRTVDLGKEIVLAGAKSRIDIWRKSEWEEFQQKDRKQRPGVYLKGVRAPGASVRGAKAQAEEQ